MALPPQLHPEPESPISAISVTGVFGDQLDGFGIADIDLESLGLIWFEGLAAKDFLAIGFDHRDNASSLPIGHAGNAAERFPVSFADLVDMVGRGMSVDSARENAPPTGKHGRAGIRNMVVGGSLPSD